MSNDKIPEGFYVYRNGSTGTNYRHLTVESAMKEAERLARMNQEHAFEVLELVGECMVELPVKWRITNDIPF